MSEMKFDEAIHYRHGVTFRCRTCNQYIDRCRCNEKGVWRKALVPVLIGRTEKIIIQMASGERRIYSRSAFPVRSHAPDLVGGHDTNFKSKGEFLCNRENEFLEIYEEVVAEVEEQLFRYVLTAKQRAAVVRELDFSLEKWREAERAKALLPKFENEKMETAELRRIFAEGGEDVRPEDVL